MAQTLRHLADFQELLGNYQIPADDPVLQDTHLVLFFGATASGSDTIMHELAKTGRYRILVSNTTRPMRVNNGVPERDGVEYWFRDEDEMLEDLRKRRMLEAEIIHNQQVSGISLTELERASEEGNIAITKVELNIINIIEAKPDTQAIMVLPPSLEESLRRLRKRGELSPEEIYRRIETAVKIYQAGWEWDIFSYVLNDTIPEAVEQAEVIIRGEQDPDEYLSLKKLVGELMLQAEDWLKTH